MHISFFSAYSILHLHLLTFLLLCSYVYCFLPNQDADVAVAYHNYIMVRDVASLPDALQRWMNSDAADATDPPHLQDRIDHIRRIMNASSSENGGVTNELRSVWDDRNQIMRAMGQRLEGEIEIFVDPSALRSTNESVASAGEAGDNVDVAIDIAICIDTTHSMEPIIESTRDEVVRLVDDIITTARRGGKRARVRIAVVPFNDHLQNCSRNGCAVGCPTRNINILRFTEVAEDAHAFLGNLRAHGGEDPCEDVLGGLFIAATELEWADDATRFVLLVGDAPCHGRVVNKIPKLFGGWDNFADHGDPRGITPEHIVQRLHERATAAAQALYIVAVDVSDIMSGRTTFMAPMLDYFDTVLTHIDIARSPVVRIERGEELGPLQKKAVVGDATEKILTLINQDLM